MSWNVTEKWKLGGLQLIKLTELKSILETSGLKVVYDDFTGQKDETPRLPFISYYVTNSTPVGADNIVISEPVDITIELYTEKKALSLEKKIKSILTDNGIYYECVGSSNPERGCHIEYIQINILT